MIDSLKSTIARHLKEWKAHNGDVANVNGLPPVLQQQLTQFDQMQIQHQVLKNNYQQKEIQLIHLQEDYKQLFSIHAKAVQDIEAQNKAIIDADQKVAVANSRVHDLDKSLQKSEDKITTFQQEQIFILQEKSNLEWQLKQLTILS